jgi:hypothetical protein
VLYESCDLQRGERQLLFHHIPKTAGSTLRYRLASLYGAERVCNAETQHELAALGKAKALSDFRFFAGHFSYSVIADFLSDAVWITFLREPTERVVSQYYNHSNPDRVPDHWKQRITNRGTWQEYVDLAEGISLKAWLELDNPLANSISCNRQVQAFIPNKVRRSVTDWSIYNAELLELAKNHITTRFSFLGIQEYFDLSLSLLETNLNILPLQDATSTIENVNTKKGFGERYQLDAEISALIHDRNLMDWELYAWAKDRFLLHAAKFVRTQQCSQHANGKDEGTVKVSLNSNSATQVDMEDISTFDVSGLHQLERSGKQAFRWTGNCTDALFIIDFDMSAADTLVSCEIFYVNCAAPEVLTSLQISVDSVDVEDYSIKENIVKNGGSIRFRFKRDRHQQSCVLKLSSSLINEEVFTGVKGRRLGLAVSGLRFSTDHD